MPRRQRASRLPIFRRAINAARAFWRGLEAPFSHEATAPGLTTHELCELLLRQAKARAQAADQVRAHVRVLELFQRGRWRLLSCYPPLNCASLDSSRLI